VVIYYPAVLPRDPMLPFSRPEIGEEEIAEVVACLRSGWITSGPRVARLEQEFAAMTGARHALAFSSCTGALHATFLALGLGPGDEVVVPALTWPATANMVVACGAVPVFADIDPATWNLDPAGLAAVVGERTRLVVPVHFAGQPCDLDGLRAALAAAGRPEVGIVEDAAHAAGSAYKGRPIGATTANGTRAACFSFHPIKNMTSAEGGMVTTDDDELAATLKLWRFHGVQRDAWKAYSASEKAPATYDVVLPGFKYNLTDLHAALGIHQLAKLARFNRRRAELAALYRAGLAGIGDCSCRGGGVRAGAPVAPLRRAAAGRAAFMEAAAAAGDRQRPAFRGGAPAPLLPAALRLARGVAAGGGGGLLAHHVAAALSVDER
jgi:UDP-4-amino-4-deoxy-L-arabinose-oxoglutarate aminotransferase